MTKRYPYQAQLAQKTYAHYFWWYPTASDRLKVGFLLISVRDTFQKDMFSSRQWVRNCAALRGSQVHLLKSVIDKGYCVLSLDNWPWVVAPVCYSGGQKVSAGWEANSKVPLQDLQP